VPLKMRFICLKPAMVLPSPIAEMMSAGMA
jgi:hypothetical protein